MSISASCQRCRARVQGPGSRRRKAGDLPQVWRRILISHASALVPLLLLDDGNVDDHAYRLLNTLTPSPQRAGVRTSSPGPAEPAPTPVRTSRASKVKTPRQECAPDTRVWCPVLIAVEG